MNAPTPQLGKPGESEGDVNASPRRTAWQAEPSCTSPSPRPA